MHAHPDPDAVPASPSEIKARRRADRAERALTMTPARALPPRQTCRVLDLLSAGLTAKDIAREMGITRDSVRRHLNQAGNAFGVAPKRHVALVQAWLGVDPDIRLQVLRVRSEAAIGALLEARASERSMRVQAGRALNGDRTRAELPLSAISVHARVVLRGRTKQCARCGYSLFVDACHIRPVRSFASTAMLKEINAPGNLVYLCPNCHREFDRGLWTITVTEGPHEAPTARQGKQSVYRGVSWHKDRNRWRACIGVQGRRVELGHFEDESDAALAYNAAALEHFGPHAALNAVPSHA